MEKHNIRFVNYKDAKYLRAEDVAILILAVAATEETDVRCRLEELVNNLMK